VRIIDADALVHDLIHNKSFYPVCVRRAIEDAPTIDAVPVVRCKDCKHSRKYPWGSYSCSFHDYEGEPHVEPNDFCNYGERKET
jgi:hypothetical protein